MPKSKHQQTPGERELEASFTRIKAGVARTVVDGQAVYTVSIPNLSMFAVGRLAQLIEHNAGFVFDGPDISSVRSPNAAMRSLSVRKMLDRVSTEGTADQVLARKAKALRDRFGLVESVKFVRMQRPELGLREAADFCRALPGKK